MSIIKRSDVKNHLSTRAGTKVLQFPSSQPDVTVYPQVELHNAPNSGAAPVQPSPVEIPALASEILISPGGAAKISVIEKPQA